METHPYIDKSGLKRQLNLNESNLKENGYKDGGIWFADTRTIICGTFPPKKEYFNRKGYIHYSSSRNKFWQQIDKIFQTDFFITNEIAGSAELRIKNSLKKINFLKSKKVGLIDIYTKINRKNSESSSDDDLIPIETIFDRDIFKDITTSSVENFVFVYSKSRDEFESQLQKRYNICFETLKTHNDGSILLGIKKCSINNKHFNLIYYPIHGNNTDEKRLPALTRIFDISEKHIADI
jgi:G:T/U-mismatch repair DNA glycosylase